MKRDLELDVAEYVSTKIGLYAVGIVFAISLFCGEFDCGYQQPSLPDQTIENVSVNLETKVIE
jgi:hypothetical protein